MVTRILTLFCCLLFISVQAQKQIQRYIKSEMHVVDSVNPFTPGYQDIKAIGDAIGDARVVMLGEVDHGDGATNLAKTRLIKYLVEEKGFDVVAFEGDFFSFNLDWKSAGWKDPVPDRDLAIAHLRNNNFGVWGNAKECLPLFQYLADGMVAQKIRVTGIDPQHHTTFSKLKYSSLFLNFLDTALLLPKGSPEDSAFQQRWQAHLRYFKSQDHKAPDSLWRALDGSLKLLYQRAKSKYGAAHFWVQEMKNLVASCEVNYLVKQGAKGLWNAFAIRDEQMADNLRWLALQKYPNSKIIVWAASGHVSRQHAYNAFWLKSQIHVMGGFFTQDPLFDSTTYVVGFTSSYGRAGRFGHIRYDVGPAKPRSFEAWAEASGADYGFVDFKQFKARRPRYHRKFYMMALNNYRNTKADWLHVFDGVFYIKEMFPSSHL